MNKRAAGSACGCFGEAGVGVWVGRRRSYGTSLATVTAPLVPPPPSRGYLPHQVFLVVPFHPCFGVLWSFLFFFCLLRLLSPGHPGEDRQVAPRPSFRLHVRSFLALLLAFFSPPFPSLSRHIPCFCWCALACVGPWATGSEEASLGVDGELGAFWHLNWKKLTTQVAYELLKLLSVALLVQGGKALA